MGIGERYQQPLRTTFWKLKLSYPKISNITLLSMSVYAMNNTLGPEGIFPSMLVLGEYPPLRMMGEALHPKATLEHRAEVANAARKEMETQMARLRIQRALRHKVTAAADRSYFMGQQVLIWR